MHALPLCLFQAVSARLRHHAAWVLCAGVALGACTQAPDPRGCPQVAVLPEAAQAVQFRPGPGRDLTDVEALAEVVDFAGGCDYDDERVEVSFDLTLAFERGPALDGNSAGFTYFVAILDPQGRGLAKRTFDIRAEFPPNVARVAGTETIDQFIPIPAGADVRDHAIVVGFQLTEDQLEFNRRERRGG